MRRLLFCSLSLLACGCTSQLAFTPTTSRESQIAMEELRTELADVKHALSSAKVEMQILEEKVKNQDQSVTTLKSSSSQKGQLQSDLSQQLSLLEKRLTQLEKMQEKVGIDLRTLSSNANQGNQVLNQYKEKISSLEQEIVFQSKRLDEVSKLKSTLSSLSKAMQGSSEGSSKSYQIKSGDSLEKIARRHNTTVDNLKKLNGLNHDKIVVGQEIQVP